MSVPLKVLHLITWFAPGGIERWLLSMLKVVDRQRVAMDFCCKGPTTGILSYEAESAGAKVYHCPLSPTHIGFIKGVGQIIRSGGYHIVHNHLENYAGVGVYAAKRCGLAVITGFHNTSFPAQMLPELPLLHKLRDFYGSFSIRYALRHSDLITGCSQGVIDFLKEKYNLRQEKGRVLYYGVKVPPQKSAAERDCFRAALGLSPDDLVITHVGRFLPQKNHMGLVRVADKVIKQDSRAHFVLVGDGPLRKSIEIMVEDRNLNRNFSFLGIRDDVEDVLGISDIFFLPSCWEGLGLVVLEAMSVGLPVVASDLQVLRETVVDNDSGILWPVHDEEGMAQQILELLADPDKRQAMGAAGRRVVEAKFSLDASAERLCQVYEGLSHS